MKLVIKSLDQIHSLPWTGNITEDLPFLDAVDSFVLSSGCRETQKEAIRLAGVYSLGDDSEVGDHELFIYKIMAQAFKKGSNIVHDDGNDSILCLPNTTFVN